VRSERGLEPSWFAYNPNCPPEIEKEIRDSGDAGSIAQLDRTRAGK